MLYNSASILYILCNMGLNRSEAVAAIGRCSHLSLKRLGDGNFRLMCRSGSNPSLTALNFAPRGNFAPNAAELKIVNSPGFTKCSSSPVPDPDTCGRSPARYPYRQRVILRYTTARGLADGIRATLRKLSG